jgi:hypothetical protein
MNQERVTVKKATDANLQREIVNWRRCSNEMMLKIE